MRATPIQPRSHVNSVCEGDSEFKNWSGARDLNPGPHGPESHNFPSRSVDFCLLQVDSSDSAALPVQIGVNLQPDYYMKYYTDAPRSAHRCLSRSAPMSCAARTLSSRPVPSLAGRRFEELRDPLVGKPEHPTRVADG